MVLGSLPRLTTTRRSPHISLSQTTLPVPGVRATRVRFQFFSSLPTPTASGVHAFRVRPPPAVPRPCLLLVFACPASARLPQLLSCLVWCSSDNGSRLTPATYHDPTFTTHLSLPNDPAYPWRPRVSRSLTVLVVFSHPVYRQRSRALCPPASGNSCPVQSGIRPAMVLGSPPRLTRTRRCHPFSVTLSHQVFHIRSTMQSLATVYRYTTLGPTLRVQFPDVLKAINDTTNDMLADQHQATSSCSRGTLELKGGLLSGRSPDRLACEGLRCV
jgi:hypothetical protein